MPFPGPPTLTGCTPWGGDIDAQGFQGKRLRVWDIGSSASLTAANGGAPTNGMIGIRSASGDQRLRFYDSTLGADVLVLRGDRAETVSEQWSFTKAIGTSPFAVTSTTAVANLNADMTDGFHASQTATASTLATRDSNGRLVAVAPSGAADGELVTYGFMYSFIQGVRDPKQAALAMYDGNLFTDHAYTFNSGNNTITINANGAFAFDGITVAVNDRVALVGETSTRKPYNGLYIVTQIGTAGVPLILQRTSDADTDAEVTNGMQFWVTTGTVHGDSGWLLTTPDPITLNTTDLTFVQNNGTAGILAGNGIVKSGNTIHAVQSAAYSPVYGLIYASSSSGLGIVSAIGTTTTVLHGNASGAPTWGAIVNADITNATIDLTTKVTATLPVTNGGSGTATAFTLGSVVFAGVSGVYTQDNANFFWNVTTHRLGIGTAAPDVNLHVDGGASSGTIKASYGSIATILQSSSGSGIGRAGTSSNHAYSLIANDVEHLRLVGDGNSYFNAGKLAVGTTIPYAKVQVVIDSFAVGGTWGTQQFVVGTAGSGGSSSIGGVFTGYAVAANTGYIGALQPDIAWGNLSLQYGGGKVIIGGTGTSLGSAIFQVYGSVMLNNAQSITTSTGILTLGTAAGDGNIVLSPHGAGDVVPAVDNTTDFGSTTKYWARGYFTNITVSATPSVGTDAANKAYVDAIGTGLRIKDPCRVATTAALPAYTFSAASNGTLTANANGSLNNTGIDGVTNLVGSTTEASANRILVKDETGANDEYNGLFYLYQLGVDGVSPWILKRTTDTDTAAELTVGCYTYIQEGTANISTSWVQENTITTLNTDAVSFNLFFQAAAYIAGVGLNLSGQTFSVNQAFSPTWTGVHTFSNSTGIVLSPHGSSTGNTMEIRFLELVSNGTNYVGFKAADSISTNRIWTLPASDGNANDYLKTSGAGVLSFAAIASTEITNTTFVTSVTGTSNRITITGTLTPTVDIASTYVGQATITTLGTITTGTWTGTAVGIGYGGTGATTATTAFNALSPLTTRGDLITRDGTNNIRLGIGTIGKFLKTDGTDPSWQLITVSDIVASGAALTKTDDTNITLTLGGSPTVALLAATSLTLGWTGTLAESRGGTGRSAFRYSTTIGDGAASSFTITHNLGTRDVTVTVYEAASPYTVWANVLIKHATTNTVTIDFGFIPDASYFRVGVI